MAEVERRQVVIVGSGFGGAVAACRLAQAGCDVLVLERGRWYGRGDFPRTLDDDWSWDSQQGVFDVDRSGRVATVRAAGVGGGSLLYSNVHLRLPCDGFDTHWPAGWSHTEIDPYYDLVAHMLGLRSIDESTTWPVPDRTNLLEEAAGVIGAARHFFHPPLAVNFGNPRTVVVNEYGAEQTGCRHCGKCSIGCNFGAKNSLDKNYLPLAMTHGAQVRARCEVTAIAAEPGGGYRVAYTDHVGGGTDLVVAEKLVLAAGAIGTTQLLLGNAADLGDLSGRLGDRYSANGDVVTVSLGIQKEWKPRVGPAITAGVLAVDEHWFLVEDGGIPPVAIIPAQVRPDVLDPEMPRREAWDLVDHSAILLGMGREPKPGKVVLDEDAEPAVEWPYAANRAYYDDVAAYHSDLGRALRQVTQVDLGPLTQVPVTVHSLGGAVMADGPESGVVDSHGEVFGAPGLFVFDGAAIPTATGVNPSHTIAAVAERNAERLARELIGDPRWEAPERAMAPRHPDPLPTS